MSIRAPPHRRAFALAVAGLCAACGSPADTPDARPAATAAPLAPPPLPTTALGRYDFELQPLGASPAGFTAANTIGPNERAATPAAWTIGAGGATATSTRCVQLTASTNRGEIFNLLLLDAPAPADVELAVRLRADGGGEDRGGGLVWRARDPQNGYVARWNPLEDNLRLYRVVGGRRVQLMSVKTAVDRAAWHLLEVAMRGRVITVRFDGEPRISCADGTFKESGRVGFWTRSNATTSFDDFTVSAPPAGDS